MNTTPAPSYAQAFDLLATLVAVVRTDGVVVFANAALEDVMGVSRRNIEGATLSGYFTETQSFENALQGAQSNAFATMRYDAHLRRPQQDPMPVHVIVAPTDVTGEVLVELLPLEQQTRQGREERLIDQAQANKELIRNLAHEIKNPLGGIRGAA
jgi:two-component system nitrogen regulation sensor histidine kinase GlnL